MITVQRELIADMLEEAKPLTQAHWREIAHYPDIELQPDWEFYRTSPALRCYTAREDGALIGYAVFGVGRNKHYMGSLQAVQDIAFVHPEHRGTAGVRMLRFAEQELRREGCQVVYHHTKKSHPLMALLLQRMGYEEVDVIYAKRLDKE